MGATEQRELKLFTENDGELYRQQTTSILKNLMTKRGQGRYDHDRAVDLFMYLAEAGARKYARLHGSGEQDWNKIFSKEDRHVVSTEWRDEFESEAALGNYDNLLPKKYQKKATPSKPTKKGHTKSYLDGSNTAQKIAMGLSGAEIRHIVQSQEMFLPTARKDPTLEFERGYLQVMQNILNSMEGS